MINLKKRPFRNDVKRVVFPLLVALWRYQLVNRPGIDFCIKTSSGNVIETGVTPLRSGGIMVSRTLYRDGNTAEYTDVTKFSVASLVKWCRTCVSLGSTIKAGTFHDQQ